MNKLSSVLVIAMAIILGAVIYSSFNTEVNAGTSTVNTPEVYNISDIKKGNDNFIVDFKFEKNGKVTSFKEFTKGKVVFINFWGTWCPPCRREIPDIIEIQKDLKAKNFIVVGMALERDANPMKKVTDFASAQGVNYVNFIASQELAAAYGGINAVPTTFIVDGNGKIVEKIVGMKDKAGFLTSINRVLK